MNGQPRFYLINFHYPDAYSQEIYTPPLGPGYILESLDSLKFPCRYWEFSHNPDLDSLIGDIGRFGPDMIGCSFFSHNYIETYAIIDRLSELGIPIVCGGVHVNARGTAILDEVKTTYAILGEGEESLPLLLRSLDDPQARESIPGLVYRKGPAIKSNSKQLLDFNAQAFPKYRGFENSRYIFKGRHISSSRGCPYQCTFCAQSALLGKKWRKRSAQSIMSELKYWASKGITEFSFIDDNFTLDKKRVKELCNLLQNSPTRFRLSTAGVRIDNVDEDLLKMMKESGFYYLSFGVESGNDRVLKEIRKGISLTSIHRTLNLACKMEFAIKLYFIINNRTETYKEALDSFRLANQYPIHLARFTNLVPYPGTYDYQWISKHGRLLYRPEDYLNRIDAYIDKPMYDGPGMSLDERRQIIRKAQIQVARYEPSVKNDFLKGLTILHRLEFKRLYTALKNRIQGKLLT